MAGARVERAIYSYMECNYRCNYHYRITLPMNVIRKLVGAPGGSPDSRDLGLAMHPDLIEERLQNARGGNDDLK